MSAAQENTTLHLFDRRLRAVERKSEGYSDLRRDVVEMQSLLARVFEVVERSLSTQNQMTNSMKGLHQDTGESTPVSDDFVKRLTAVEVQLALTAIGEEALGAPDEARGEAASKGVKDVENAVVVMEGATTETNGNGAAALQNVNDVLEEVAVNPLGEADTKLFASQSLTASDSQPKRNSSSGSASAASTFIDECSLETYSIDTSIWDAFIFVFCVDQRGNRVITRFESVVLLFGFVINLMMQSTFVLIVFNLVQDADFNEEQTEILLEWRASSGHILDAATGTSQVARLCSKLSKQWTLQKNDVTQLHAYEQNLEVLGHMKAGFLLSLMSLLLWSMMILKEFRSVVSQFFGIVNIPSRPGSRFSLAPGTARFEGAGDDLSCSIADIGGATRLLIILLLTVPRMFLLIYFAYLGAQFVAQTPGLVDLVLNAIALAFVFDIDELMASITFTQNLFRACEHMQPLPCGGSGKFRTGVRLVLWMGILLMSVVLFLVPYWDQLMAAKYVLCGGDQGFIVEGGTHTMPTTVIIDMADAQYGTNGDDPLYRTSCDAWSFNKYLETKYHISSSRGTTEEDNNQVDATTNRELITLQYAFRNEADFSNLPTAVQNVFINAEIGGQKLEEPGAGVVGLEDCPRLYPNYQLGWDACRPVPALDADSTISNCSWTRMGELCEGLSPGNLYITACDISTAEAQAKSCDVWNMFGVENPLVHCSNGAEPMTLEMHGAFSLSTNNATRLYEAFGNETLRTELVFLMQRSFEELPPENRIEGTSRLQLSYHGDSLVVIEGLNAFVGTGSSGRLLSSSIGDGGGRRHLAAHVATRRLQSSGSLSDEVSIQFRIDKLPATLTTTYLSKVDWAKLSDDIGALLHAGDASLTVGPVSELISTASSATCDTYVWCAVSDKILKADAHLILGSSESVCCDDSCFSMWRQGALSQELCEPLGPYELIPSDYGKSITRVGTADSRTVCCVEQQLCEALNVANCAFLAGPHYDALIADASTRYQGVTGSGNEVECCSMSCAALQQHGIPIGHATLQFGCDAAERQTLVGNASSVVPSNIIDPVLVAAGCCETTSTFCDEWEAQNPETNCEANNKALYREAHTTLGEHVQICCVESCANVNIQCPADYTVWPELQTRFVRNFDQEDIEEDMQTGGRPPTWAPTQGPTIVEATCSQDRDLVGPEENMVILDDSILASSYKANDDKCGYEFSTATRIGYAWGAWCSEAQNGEQWLQWDLGVPTRITAIQSQGHPVETWWVTSYAVSFSMDGWHWSTMSRAVAGNADNTQVVESAVQATVARYVRIIPRAWFLWISMRATAVGCAAEEGYDQPTHRCPSGYVPHSGHLNSELDDNNHVLCAEVRSTMEACAVVCNATKGCLAFQWSASSSACSCSSLATPDTAVVMGDSTFCGKREVNVPSSSQCCTPLPACSDFTDDDCIAGGRDFLIATNTSVATEDFIEVCCVFSCNSGEAFGYTCPTTISFSMALTENASTTEANVASQAHFEVDCCVYEAQKDCDESYSDPRGQDYRGCQDQTRDGVPCQAWSSQSPQEHDRTPTTFPNAGLGDHNHCRNPDGSQSIWCYTLDADIRWDFCDPVPEASICETTSVGTAAEGSRCFFPFEYRGELYDRCIPFDKNESAAFWCSTTSVYGGFWGGCDCDDCQCKPSYPEVFVSVYQWGGYAYTDTNRMCATDGTQGTVSGSAALCADADATGEISSSDCSRECIESRCAAELACVGYSAPSSGNSFILLSSIGELEQSTRWQTFRKNWR